MTDRRASITTVTVRGTVEIRGVNPLLKVAGVELAAIALGRRGPVPVRFRVTGVPERFWTTNLMPEGDGTFLLYLNETVRRPTGIKVGDRVAFEIENDETYRQGPTHPMPAEFARGIARDATARSNWQEFPPSLKKEVLRYFGNLRSTEARHRNVVRALRVLSGRRERFLGRAWALPDARNSSSRRARERSSRKPAAVRPPERKRRSRKP